MLVSVRAALRDDLPSVVLPLDAFQLLDTGCLLQGVLSALVHFVGRLRELEHGPFRTVRVSALSDPHLQPSRQYGVLRWRCEAQNLPASNLSIICFRKLFIQAQIL